MIKKYIFYILLTFLFITGCFRTIVSNKGTIVILINWPVSVLKREIPKESEKIEIKLYMNDKEVRNAEVKKEKSQSKVTFENLKLGKYKIYAVAYKDDLKLAEGETEFEIKEGENSVKLNLNSLNTAPSKPILKYPIENYVYPISNIDLIWENSYDEQGDIIFYEILSGESIDNLYSAIKDITLSNYSKIFEDNKKYFWKIKAYDKKENGETESSISYFYIETDYSLKVKRGNYVNNTKIEILLKTEGRTKYKTSNDGKIWTEWKDIVIQGEHELNSGDGEKKIYTVFLENIGKESGIYCVKTVLDTVKPYGSINIKNIDRENLKLNVILSGYDNNGILKMVFSNDKVNWSSEENFEMEKAIEIKETDKEIFVKFIDIAGNESDIYGVIIPEEIKTLNILSHEPLKEDTDVIENITVKINFDKDIDENDLNINNVYISKGTDKIAINPRFSDDNKKEILLPLNMGQKYDYGGYYTVTVKKELKAKTGEQMYSDYSWNFRIIAKNYYSDIALGNNGDIYANSVKGVLYSLDKNGNKNWTKIIGENIYTTPSFYNDKIYITTLNGKVYSLDNNGNIKWKSVLKNGVKILSKPLVDISENVFAVNFDGELYALDKDGKKLWSYITGGVPFYTNPIKDDFETIYITTTGTIWGIEDNGKNYKMQYDNIEGQILISRITLDKNGNMYVGDSKGNLYVIDSEAKLKYKYKAENQINSTPLIDTEMNVYFGCDSGKVYKLDKNGELKWDFSTKGKIYSRISEDSKGDIYISSSDSYLYKLSNQGEEIWRYYAAEEIYSTPIIDEKNERIYILTLSEKIHAITNNGEKLWIEELK